MNWAIRKGDLFTIHVCLGRLCLIVGKAGMGSYLIENWTWLEARDEARNFPSVGITKINIHQLCF